MPGTLVKLETLSQPAQEPVAIDDFVFYLHADGNEKPLLEDILLSARQEIEEKTGKAFFTQTLQATYSFPYHAMGIYSPEEDDRMILELPRSPVQSVTSVAIEITQENFSVVAPENYLVSLSSPTDIALFATAFGGVTFPWWISTHVQPRARVVFVAGHTSVDEVSRGDTLLIKKLGAYHYLNREEAQLPPALSRAINARKIWTL